MFIWNEKKLDLLMVDQQMVWSVHVDILFSVHEMLLRKNQIKLPDIKV